MKLLALVPSIRELLYSPGYPFISCYIDFLKFIETIKQEQQVSPKCRREVLEKYAEKGYIATNRSENEKNIAKFTEKKRTNKSSRSEFEPKRRVLGG